jgi:hypothetical protein
MYALTRLCIVAACLMTCKARHNNELKAVTAEDQSGNVILLYGKENHVAMRPCKEKYLSLRVDNAADLPTVHADNLLRALELCEGEDQEVLILKEKLVEAMESALLLPIPIKDQWFSKSLETWQANEKGTAGSKAKEREEMLARQADDTQQSLQLKKKINRIRAYFENAQGLSQAEKAKLLNTNQDYQQFMADLKELEEMLLYRSPRVDLAKQEMKEIANQIQFINTQIGELIGLILEQGLKARFLYGTEENTSYQILLQLYNTARGHGGIEGASESGQAKPRLRIGANVLEPRVIVALRGGKILTPLESNLTVQHIYDLQNSNSQPVRAEELGSTHLGKIALDAHQGHLFLWDCESGCQILSREVIDEGQFMKFGVLKRQTSGSSYGNHNVDGYSPRIFNKDLIYISDHEANDWFSIYSKTFASASPPEKLHMRFVSHLGGLALMGSKVFYAEELSVMDRIRALDIVDQKEWTYIPSEKNFRKIRHLQKFDDSHIVFSAEKFNMPKDDKRQIYLSNIGSGEITQLTFPEDGRGHDAHVGSMVAAPTGEVVYYGNINQQDRYDVWSIEPLAAKPSTESKGPKPRRRGSL